MERIELGSGGPLVSRVALGTWTFAGDKIWGESDRATCERVIHSALDQGISLFDTAPNYGDGRSEQILGAALRGRSQAFVATKLKVDGKSASDLRQSVQDSLQRLERDTIDILQIHWPDATAEGTIEALDAFASLKKEGLVRRVGVCNFGVFDLAETTEYEIVSNQIPYSLLWRVAEDRIAPSSQNRGAATIAYSPLQQGLLTGKYRSLEEFPVGRRRTRHFSGRRPNTRHTEQGMEAEVEEALKRLAAVSSRVGRPLLELALAFAASRPFIDVVLVGARSEEQLSRTIAGCTSELTESEVEALEGATEDLRKRCGGALDMYQTESRVRFPDDNGNPIRMPHAPK